MKGVKTMFVKSTTDTFHKYVALEFLRKVFAVANRTPQHTYQILTKGDTVLEGLSIELDR